MHDCNEKLESDEIFFIHLGQVLLFYRTGLRPKAYFLCRFPSLFVFYQTIANTETTNNEEGLYVRKQSSVYHFKPNSFVKKEREGLKILNFGVFFWTTNNRNRE